MAAETVAEEMAENENVTKEVAETNIVTVKLAGGAPGCSRKRDLCFLVFWLKFSTFLISQ